MDIGKPVLVYGSSVEVLLGGKLRGGSLLCFRKMEASGSTMYGMENAEKEERQEKRKTQVII